MNIEDKKLLFKQIFECFPEEDTKNGFGLHMDIYEKIDVSINIFLVAIGIRRACSIHYNESFYTNFKDKNGDIVYNKFLENYKNISQIGYLVIPSMTEVPIHVFYNINEEKTVKELAKSIEENTDLYLENDNIELFENVQIDYGKLMDYPEPMPVHKCLPDIFVVRYKFLAKDVRDNLDIRIPEKYQDLMFLSFRINATNIYATGKSIEIYNEIQKILLETLNIKTQFHIENFSMLQN